MQVTVETTEGLERKMHVIVPSERIETQVAEKIKQTAQQAKINGFRPGKVPMREVKRRFGEGIRQEVSSELIQSSYGEALQKEEINPAGMPKIEEVKIEAGKDLEYVAIFEVFPDVVVKPFDTISVERLTATIEESDLDTMIETLREQRMAYVEVSRASAEKDQVKIDFEGFVDGEAFEGGKAEGTDLILGSGSMIPGFEDGITGMSAGDEKDIDVNFPEEYQAENLAGKAAIFKIKVHSVSEPQKPELNEEFFEQFDVKEGGMDAFREEVKGNMQRELDQAINSKVKEQVMDGLDKDNEVLMPSALIDQEIDRMRQEAVQRFGGGAQFDPSMLPAEMFKDQAEKRVKIGLLVSSIVEQNNMRPDDAKVKETIETMASQYEDSEQVISHYYNNEQQLNQIQNMVLEDQLVDFILETAKVTDSAVSYEEAVKREEPAMAASEADETDEEATDGASDEKAK